jgi:hypothetical protein
MKLLGGADSSQGVRKVALCTDEASCSRGHTPVGAGARTSITGEGQVPAADTRSAPAARGKVSSRRDRYAESQ